MPTVLFTVCAVLYAALAVYVLASAKPARTDATHAIACIATAVWTASVAIPADLLPLGRAMPSGLELLRGIAWFAFVAHLYHRAVLPGDKTGLSPVFLAAFALTIAGIVYGIRQTALREWNLGPDVLRPAMLDPTELACRLGFAVCAILLIENIWRNASGDLRWHVALPCIAIGTVFIYDILLYGDAVLFRDLSPALSEGRAVAVGLTAPLLALSVNRNRRRWGASLHVSRTVVFHTASLVIIGGFLLALAATGEVLRLIGANQPGDWVVVMEVALACIGVLAAGVVLTSGSARSSIRSMIVDNFYAQRFDYRAEWLRCIGTLSQPGAAAALHTRAIRAVAQTVDSPSGLLFLRESTAGSFRWAGSWNLPPVLTPLAADHPIAAWVDEGAKVLTGTDALPELAGVAELWLAVPLTHAGEIIGLTLLSKPRAPFPLDREVFDLLRTLGQETASHIAQQQAAEALLQTRQLRAYGQRFAFVAHDIKNIASQLSLLLANAEHHISNPDFQKDMLQTVGGSVQKITVLLARLKAPEDDSVAHEPATTFAPAQRIAALAAARPPAQRDRLELDLPRPSGGLAHDDAGETTLMTRLDDIAAWMVPAEFDAVIAHLLDNAFEASAAASPVRIALRQAAERVIIEISDQGTGMTADFIRDRLFMPFASSKAGGTGLGVYQARELLRQAGGDLLVASTPGTGTTMQISLPRHLSHPVAGAA